MAIDKTPDCGSNDVEVDFFLIALIRIAAETSVDACQERAHVYRVCQADDAGIETVFGYIPIF